MSTWSQVPTQPYMNGGGYPMMGQQGPQGYEQLRTDSHYMTDSAGASASSRFYDRAVPRHDVPEFPSAAGTTAMKQAKAGRAYQDYHPPSIDCSCLGYAGTWLFDHAARVMVWIGAAAVLYVAASAITAVVTTLGSQSFLIFSQIAFESWFPSFYVILVGLIVLILAAMLIVAFVFFVSYKETRPSVRAFYVSSATLGCIMLCMSGICYLYSRRARPYVIRASNLLCQDTKVWGCPARKAVKATGGRLLSEWDNNATVSPGLSVEGEEAVEVENVEEASWQRTLQGVARLLRGEAPATTAEIAQEDGWVQQAVFSFVRKVKGGGSGDVDSVFTGRRLNPSVASMAFVKSLDRTVDPSNNIPKGCETIWQICEPPPSFDPTTACICSGMWTYAPATTPPPLYQQPTVAPQPVAPQPVAPTEAVVPPAAGGRRLGDHRGFSAEAAAEPRALSGQPDLWAGSLGAYCNQWPFVRLNSLIDGEWCFVAAGQRCGKDQQSMFESSGNGYEILRSTAPCSGLVESRSALILEGLDSFGAPLQMCAILGSLLLVLAGCGAFLFARPSKETHYVGSDPRAPAMQSGPGGSQSPRNGMNYQQLEQAFQDAQAKAVNKLTKNTPEELKIMLYGFYKQATEGDVRGDRPSIFSQKDRTKYDAWVEHNGLSHEDAIAGYIKTVAILERT
eukprot:CAMPEP_0115056412 /NCGR_PEP_ID=MMETSP0227-20121206/5176_1 /TAXON_ID=89957 /ORGANISM="Polarella glacialis, Strain CCMP 1383" /LENGTH=676 /DNA_ID=CAMNT_0002441077 /DNA_START=8 /DNA_END=2035 /DNA_ORIENTATION=+